MTIIEGLQAYAYAQVYQAKKKKLVSVSATVIAEKLCICTHLFMHIYACSDPSYILIHILTHSPSGLVNSPPTALIGGSFFI